MSDSGQRPPTCAACVRCGRPSGRGFDREGPPVCFPCGHPFPPCVTMDRAPGPELFAGVIAGAAVLAILAALAGLF